MKYLNLILKIKERIDRLFSLKKPIFIRLETRNLCKKKMEEYYNLEMVLNKYFEEWRLILISKNKYESENTKWFELENFSNNWKYIDVNWKNIFDYYQGLL